MKRLAGRAKPGPDRGPRHTAVGGSYTKNSLHGSPRLRAGRVGRREPAAVARLHDQSSPLSSPIARRSRLVGRPAPGGRAAEGAGSVSRPGTRAGIKSSIRSRALSAPPRRSAKPATLRTRTDRSSATVTTSPSRTVRLAPVTRSPLRRTWPDAASAAAAVRVRTSRACQSHLSMRWRSNVSRPLLSSAAPWRWLPAAP